MGRRKILTLIFQIESANLPEMKNRVQSPGFDLESKTDL